MILLFLLWLWLLGAAVVLGASLLKGEQTSEPFSFAAVLGLLVLPGPLLLFSLAGPVRFIHFLAVYTLLPALAYWWRRPRLPRPAWWPLLLLLAAGAWNASGPAMLHDTGLYHYPLVIWLKDFGTVPGQALFHGRFGFSSPWFAATAALDGGWLDGRAGAIFNGLLLVIAMYHFALASARWLAGRARPDDPYFLAGYLICLTYSAASEHSDVSLSPNWPVAIAVIFVCAAPVRAAWLFAAAATGVKISALPVAALAMLRLRPRHAGVFVLGLLLLAPVLAANWVSSGCPLYPAEVFCSDAPAAIGSAHARGHRRAILGQVPPKGSPAIEPTLAHLDWVRPWLRRRTQLPFAAVWLTAVIVLLLKRQGDFGVLCAAVGLVFVLVEAPGPRFAIGYAAALWGLAALGVRWPSSPRAISPAAIAALGAVLLVAKAATLEAVYRRLFHLDFQTISIERIVRPALVQFHGASGPVFHSHDILYQRSPASDQCWGARQPCTPFLVDNIQLCQPALGIRGGICRVDQAALSP